MNHIDITNHNFNNNNIMEVEYVIKRDGIKEEVSFDKVLRRIKNLSENLSINPTQITRKVNSELYPDIHTAQIDELASQICASLSTEHPDYGELASRIIISNHHKNTYPSFTETAKLLYEHSLISENLYNIIISNGIKLNDIIDYERDYLLDYFGFKTLEKSYLMRINKKIIERPQHLFLRVALAIHQHDIKDAIETYEYMSKKYFIHATPTLYNAGTNRQQLSSCFLLPMCDDSIKGIFKTLSDCAEISKWAGGIGLHISNIRAKNSYISGTNGHSNGLVPMLRVFNNTARYVDQGGGKRPGSIAIYIEPWHRDIYDVLDLRKNHGAEEYRARDLFYALWIPDLFMRRVKNDEKWSLFCPNICKGLADCYGDEFDALYQKYENDDSIDRKTVNARDLWKQIIISQIETGTPYICFKDAANKKSNQQNLGTIKSSNLCTEIIEYSSPTEYAVCNLASISLTNFVDPETKTLDYKLLHKITKIITKNLNKIIDINYYPVPETKRSNKLHRPIGIGVQGLADVFALMKIGFDSEDAAIINENIFETIYHGAIETSYEISKKREIIIKKIKELEQTMDSYKHNTIQLDKNKIESIEKEYHHLINTHNPIKEELDRTDYLGAYSSYANSPISKGLFQFDLWGVKMNNERYNWDSLKNDIKKHGIRNSLLLAPMPTASTSQILGNNECIEPFTSNIYIRRTLAGEFIVMNKHLIKDLLKLKLWDENLKNEIIKFNGSIHHINNIPDNIKNIYKTVWEMGNKPLINMAVSRGKFICQSQSLNLFMEKPELEKLTSMHFYSWEKGLKTGIYYLRTKAVAQPQQFTIEPENKTKNNSSKNIDTSLICRKDDPDCLTCSA